MRRLSPILTGLPDCRGGPPRDHVGEWKSSAYMASMRNALPFGAGAAPRARAGLSRGRSQLQVRMGGSASAHCSPQTCVTNCTRYSCDTSTTCSELTGTARPRAMSRSSLRARAPSRAQAEHVLQCAVRIVRALMGQTAISAKKVEHGSPLVVLGLRIKARTRAHHGAASSSGAMRARARATRAAADRRWIATVSPPGRQTTKGQSGASGSGRRCAPVN